MRRTRPAVAGIEDEGMGSRGRECGWLLEPGKGKGTYSLALPEGNIVLLTC